MNESKRHGTAIHEAAHAVVSCLLDVPLLHLAILDDTHGEAVPECSLCQTCLNYYHQQDPAEDPHSRTIQDDLRRRTAIAVAGEIGEECLLPGGRESTDEELLQDRQLAKSRVAATLMRSGDRCYSLGTWDTDVSCAMCDAFLNSFRAVVRQLVTKPVVSEAITALAQHLETHARISGDEVRGFLHARDLQPGSVSVNSLPSVPGEAEDLEYGVPR